VPPPPAPPAPPAAPPPSPPAAASPRPTAPSPAPSRPPGAPTEPTPTEAARRLLRRIPWWARRGTGWLGVAILVAELTLWLSEGDEPAPSAALGDEIPPGGDDPPRTGDCPDDYCDGAGPRRYDRDEVGSPVLRDVLRSAGQTPLRGWHAHHI